MSLHHHLVAVVDINMHRVLCTLMLTTPLSNKPHQTLNPAVPFSFLLAKRYLILILHHHLQVLCKCQCRGHTTFTRLHRVPVGTIRQGNSSNKRRKPSRQQTSTLPSKSTRITYIVFFASMSSSQYLLY